MGEKQIKHWRAASKKRRTKITKWRKNHRKPIKGRQQQPPPQA